MVKWLKDSLRNWLLPESKGDGLGLLPLNNFSNLPTYNTEAKYKTVAESGFQGNEIVNKCIRLKFRSFAEAPLRIVNQDKETILKHQALDIIRNPNPFTSENLFMQMLSLYYDLAGNVFIEKVRSSSGQIVELNLLRPDLVEIVPSQVEFISHYIYTIGGRKYPLPKDDVLHIKSPHPLDQYFGLSPIVAAFRQIDTDNEATDFTKVMLENRGASPGVLIGIGDNVMTKEKHDRYSALWKARYSGKNRGTPMFVEGLNSVNTISLNMHELALPELRDISEARICMVLDTPPVLAGVNVGLKNMTYSNYEQARLDFYQSTIRPNQRHIESELTRGILSEFDENLKYQFDVSEIAALAPIRKANREEARLNLQGGFITVNEARALNGLPSASGQDVFLRGMAVFEIPMAVEKQGKKEKKSLNDVALIQHAIGRRDIVEKWMDKLQQKAADELNKEFEEILGLTKSHIPVETKVPFASLSQFIEAIPGLQKIWEDRIQDDIVPFLAEILGQAAGLAVEELGEEVRFDITSETMLKFVREYGFKFAKRISDTTAEHVRRVITQAEMGKYTLDQLTEELQKVNTSWTESRAVMIARTEVIRAGNAGADTAWMECGVSEAEWLAAGDSCPYCKALDGTRQSIGEPFLKVGDSFQPEFADKPLNVTYEDVYYPPVHPHCRCTKIPIVE